MWFHLLGNLILLRLILQSEENVSEPVSESQAEEQVTGRRYSAGRWFLGVLCQSKAQ